MTCFRRISHATFPTCLAAVLLSYGVSSGQQAIEEKTKQVQLLALRPERVILVGVTRRSVADEEVTPFAWLTDRDARRTTTVKQGALLQIGGTSATIVHIASHNVYVKVKSKIHKWKLGTPFSELIKQDPRPAEPEEGKGSEANGHITVRAGQSIRISMATKLPKLLSENAAIVTLQPVSPTAFEVTGKSAGSTTVIVWDEYDNETPLRIVVVR